MAHEIERKFLVIGDDWRHLADPVLFRQGYLNSTMERTVRLRRAGDRAYLTVKGPNRGMTRAEFEYEIPVADCEAMLDALAEKPLIEKTRRRIPWRGHVWEVDEFFGENAGLIVAEIELASEDERFVKPPWIGEEVGADPRYYNANLIAHPYSQWKR